jgi:hypothetical protein
MCDPVPPWFWGVASLAAIVLWFSLAFARGLGASTRRILATAAIAVFIGTIVALYLRGRACPSDGDLLVPILLESLFIALIVPATAVWLVRPPSSAVSRIVVGLVSALGYLAWLLVLFAGEASGMCGAL